MKLTLDKSDITLILKAIDARINEAPNKAVEVANTYLKEKIEKQIANIYAFKLETVTWFDKTNGNPYFACHAVTYGQGKAYHIHIPMQYGRDGCALQEVLKVLKEKNLISFEGWSEYDCKKNGIDVSHSVHAISYYEIKRFDKEGFEEVAE